VAWLSVFFFFDLGFDSFSNSSLLPFLVPDYGRFLFFPIHGSPFIFLSRRALFARTPYHLCPRFAFLQSLATSFSPPWILNGVAGFCSWISLLASGGKRFTNFPPFLILCPVYGLLSIRSPVRAGIYFSQHVPFHQPPPLSFKWFSCFQKGSLHPLLMVGKSLSTSLWPPLDSGAVALMLVHVSSMNFQPALFKLSSC